MRLKRFLVAVGALLVGYNFLPAEPAPPLASVVERSADSFICSVTGVHDGDGPIYCAEGPRIRLAAVAARELDESCNPDHPCPVASGAEAKAALNRLVDGRTLRCESAGTSYGRVTAWCWLPDGREVNCEMVRTGTVLRWARFDPDYRLTACR